MMGVATLLAHQRNSLVDKAPRMRGSCNTFAKPAREAGEEPGQDEDGRKEGGGYAKRGQGRIDVRRWKGSAIEASTEQRGEKWRGRGGGGSGGGGGGLAPPGGGNKLHSDE